MGKDNAFLIGEAAGFISPSSLEGISYAIDSGYALCKCLNNSQNNTNRAYSKATRNIRIKLLLKTAKRPFMYNPVLRNLVMRSGLSAVSMVQPL